MSEATVGDYSLLYCVASGGQTQIWEVSHPGSPEHLAMKLMLPEAFQDAANVRTLRHEAKVGSSFEHPNIIQLHEFAATRSEAYIVMEFFRAPNLKTQIKTDLEGLQIRLRRVMEGACLALAEMHDHGWIHKDVKPDNFVANKAGEVKLVDFSLAVRVQGGLGKLLGGGKPKTIQGTRTYIAPETIRKQVATPATDVYSLGVMLYEILTGLPPYQGTSPNDLLAKHLSARPPEPSARNPNVTTELDTLVKRMLAKKAENRPQSMEELYSEMRSIPMFREAVTVTSKAEEEVDQGDDEARLDSRADAARTASAGGRRRSRRPSRPSPQPAQPPAPQVAQPQPSMPPQPSAPNRTTAPPQPVAQQPIPQQPGAQPPVPPPQAYPQPGQPPNPYGQPYPPQPYGAPAGVGQVPPQPPPMAPQTPAQWQPPQPVGGMAPPPTSPQPMAPQQPSPPPQVQPPRGVPTPPAAAPPVSQQPSAPVGDGDAPPVRRRRRAGNAAQPDPRGADEEPPMMTELPPID